MKAAGDIRAFYASRIPVPCTEDWVAVKALAVVAGDSTRVAAEITAETQAAGLTAEQRHGADTCVRYLTSKHEFLRYDQALLAGHDRAVLFRAVVARVALSR